MQEETTKQQGTDLSNEQRLRKALAQAVRTLEFYNTPYLGGMEQKAQIALREINELVSEELK